MLIAGELYQLLSKMRLINTWPGIILAWLAYFTPFGSYIMTTYFSTVPKDILESAKMDNANVSQVLFMLMMPIAKPMLGTLCIIGALSMWEELPFSMMILQQNSMRTVTLGVALMQDGVSVPILAAAFIASSIIPFIAYIFFQNLIAMGATAGSVKG
jgi:multiple sugar transport system permease protein/raffinose/stachyose/melibiose transport system permease protein